jgi:hypothetical protein
MKVDTNNKVLFHKRPTRWLEVWLDKKLNIHHHHEVIMAKVKTVQGGVNRITVRLKLKPEHS